MSGTRSKTAPTIASMNKRNAINKMMAQSPPTPPPIRYDDDPRLLVAPINQDLRRSAHKPEAENTKSTPAAGPQGKAAPKKAKNPKKKKVEFDPAPDSAPALDNAPASLGLQDGKAAPKKTGKKGGKVKKDDANPAPDAASDAVPALDDAPASPKKAGKKGGKAKKKKGNADPAPDAAPAPDATSGFNANLALNTAPAPPASPVASEKSVADLMVVDDSRESQTPAPTGAGKGKGKARAENELGLELAPPSKSTKSAPLAMVRASNTGQMVDYDEKLPGRRTPTEEDYDLWSQRFEQAGDIENAFAKLDTGNLDWFSLPPGVDVRSGRVDKATVAKLEAVAQGAAFLVANIAAKAKISKATAWKYTGLLQVESRAKNSYNLYCKQRAAELREENGGKPVGDSTETNKILSKEWKEMTDYERDGWKDRLRREHFKADVNLMKGDLVNYQDRERFLQDQADSLSTLATQLNVRTDLIMLGMLVMPSTSVSPAVSTCFTSSAVAVEAWKRHDTQLGGVMSYIAKKATGGVTADLLDWPAPEMGIWKESERWVRDKCLGWALKYLCVVQRLSAPWHDTGKGEFMWRDSNKNCAKFGYVLCGWPDPGVFPGSVKANGVHSATRNLKKGGSRKVILKFTLDREEAVRTASNMVGLQYYKIDALTVTKDGLVIETATATPEELEGSKPLSAYPELDRPVLVSDNAEVLVFAREIEDKEAKRHRNLLENATDALQDEDQDGPSDSAVVAHLPALKFHKKRASVTSTATLGVKAEQDSEDEDEDEDVVEGGKGKGRAKPKAKAKVTKRPRQVSVSDDEEDMAQSQEKPAKRRKKSEAA